MFKLHLCLPDFITTSVRVSSSSTPFATLHDSSRWTWAGSSKLCKDKHALLVSPANNFSGTMNRYPLKKQSRVCSNASQFSKLITRLFLSRYFRVHRCDWYSYEIRANKIIRHFPKFVSFSKLKYKHQVCLINYIMIFFIQNKYFFAFSSPMRYIFLCNENVYLVFV